MGHKTYGGQFQSYVIFIGYDAFENIWLAEE